MKSPLLAFLFLFLFFANSFSSLVEAKKEFNVLFYNVENLFDTFDDETTADDEFTPIGSRHWTKRRFQKKIANISKAILSSCDFHMPDIVGLCEVENRFVLEQLINKTPLAKFDYQIIHKDSPDPRGIDVAILYRKEQCIPISFNYIPLRDDKGKIIRSREILYACFEVFGKDTLHVYFNHWPSRYGGQTETEHKRIRAAKQVRQEIEKLQQKFRSPKIVLMGDFNDGPNNKSMKDVLMAVEVSALSKNEIVNLSSEWKKRGTLKHKQSWVVFDQVLVTGSLLSQKKGIYTKTDHAEIVGLGFLLEDDPKFLGKRLFRTYHGMKYHGGFSDHLPIRLKLNYSD